MIEVSENLLINADVQTVWAFLTDVEKSLSFNRFHIEIRLPNRFSVNNKSKFTIIHNLGFGIYKMTAKILNCKPPICLSISEQTTSNPKRGFSHIITFELEPKGDMTILTYSLKGTYGRKVQDMSFKPILKGVMIDELRQLKKAIESSQRTEVDETAKSYNPI